MRFGANDVRICAIIVCAEHIEYIEVFRRVDMRAAFVAPVVINAHVVGNAHSPLYELPFVVVLSPTECVNNLDEDLLENIFSEGPIFDKEIDRGVNFGFVAREKDLESLFITVHVTGDQFMIVEHRHNLHTQKILQ
jgi:hypothetical protein